MSTRAMYTFIDDRETYHVYRHYDGYPTGAAQWITAALAFAWPLPRYEAADFAAAFIAANKLPSWLQEAVMSHLEAVQALPKATDFKNKKMSLKVEVPSYAMGTDFGRGGGVYMMPSGSVYAVAHGDLEYRYEIYQSGDALRVRAFAVDFWKTRTKNNEKLIFECALSEIGQRAEEWQNEQDAANAD